MSEPTNATDAVQRVRDYLADHEAAPDDQCVDRTAMESFTFADLRAVLARLADVEAENADLWTELHLCRQMCRATEGTR